METPKKDIGSYKNTPITPGTDAEVQAQIASIDAPKPVVEQPKLATDTSQIRRETVEAGKKPKEVGNFKTFDEFKAGLVPEPKAPEVPPYEDKYKTLRASQGIPAVEDEIIKYQEEQVKAQDEMNRFKTSLKYGSVSETAGGFQGRLSEEQQIVQDRINYNANLEAVAYKKLEFKNDYIKNIMGFTKEDYTTALDSYEKEFNKNISLQNAYSTEKNRVTDDARATITTAINMMTNSATGKTIDDLPKESQAKLQEQCLIAGVDYEALKTFVAAKPKANIVGQGTESDAGGNQFFWTASMEPGETIPTITKVYTGGIATSLTDDANKAAAIHKADIFFSSLEGSVPLDTYRDKRTDWVAAGGAAAEFDKTFGSYLSKADQSKLNVSAITNTKGPKDWSSILGGGATSTPTK